jgi:hypothetical protein
MLRWAQEEIAQGTFRGDIPQLRPHCAIPDLRRRLLSLWKERWRRSGIVIHKHVEESPGNGFNHSRKSIEYSSGIVPQKANQCRQTRVLTTLWESFSIQKRKQNAQWVSW